MKFYCEFILGEIPNYSDMCASKGRDGESSFQRLGALHDLNAPRAPVSIKQTEHIVVHSIVKEHVEAHTLGTISAMTWSFIWVIFPFLVDELHHYRGHMCMSCGALYTFTL